MLQARAAARPSLTSDVDVGKSRLRAAAARACQASATLSELAEREVREGSDVPRGVDDDLLSAARGAACEQAVLLPSSDQGPNAGNLFGTTRTRQPGESAGRPGGPSAKVSGGVALSRPSQKGSPRRRRAPPRGGAVRARPPRPRGRDHDPAPRDRVAPELGGGPSALSWTCRPSRRGTV